MLYPTELRADFLLLATDKLLKADIAAGALRFSAISRESYRHSMQPSLACQHHGK
jgi:hypothetical protein